MKLKFLLESFDVDQEDSFGRTPLYEAIEEGNKKVVYELKNNGATNFGKYRLVRDLLFK